MPHLRSALELLVRTQKAMRMYQAASPVTARLGSELHARLTSILDDYGEIELGVRESQILFDEQVVYDSRDRRESLAFLLFRDGLRSLTLRPGLERDELLRFLSCLNRGRTLDSGEDDLVNLLWEEDFRSISYVAVEELGEDPIEQPSLDGLPDRTSDWRAGWGTEKGSGGTDAVSLEDVKPLSRLPVEAASLSEQEIESLRREIAAEQALDLRGLVPDLAAEIAWLEPGEKERRQLARDLLAVLDARLEVGDVEAVVVTANRLGELARTTFADSDAVGRVYAELKDGLADRGRLERLLSAALRSGGLDKGMQRLLARLPEQSQQLLVAWLGRFPRAEDRRALTDVLLASGERCLGAVSRQLDTFLESSDLNALSEVLHLARELPLASLPMLQRLLRSDESPVRREAALALGRLEGDEAASLWLELLDDCDAGLRSLAIAALSRSDRRTAAPEILARVCGAEAVERSEEELRRAVAAVARLAGDEALPWLAVLLQPERRRWFATRREQELVRAAAHGVSTVGSDAARRLLETLARNGDRVCRAACAAELGATR